MAGIRITKFGGIAPAIADHVLPAQMATVAENVNLANGTIRPWLEPKKEYDAVGASIWVDDCCAIGFTDCHASLTRNRIGCERLYATDTGHGYPVTADRSCTPVWCRLGFPCDIPAPIVTSLDIVGSFDDTERKRQNRSYVYTLVNQWGEESQPSPASEEIETDSTGEIMVFNIPSAFPGYCVTKVRIYRTETELTYGGDKQDISEAGYFEVAEINVGETTFTDNVTALGDELTTLEYDPPNANLREIQWVDGSNQLAALSGNKLAFSERNNSHAWPSYYTLTFRHKPRRFLAAATHGFVLTDGCPAVVQMVAGCDSGMCHKVVECLDTHPILSRRSAAIHNGHAVYASKDGLVLLSPSGQAQILTNEYFSQDQWHAIQPWTMQGVVHDGHYFGFCKDYAFRLRIPDATYAKTEDRGLTTLTIRPTAVYRSDGDELYFALADGTYRWNADVTHMTARWRGSLLDLPGITALSAFKVVHRHGDVSTTHWVDDDEIDVTNVTDIDPQRLPLESGIDWQVQFVTKGEITEYHIASSVMELAQGAG